jgi:hypothetical protein
VGEGDVDQVLGPADGDAHGSGDDVGGVGRMVDAVAVEKVVEEPAVLGRDERLDLRHRRMLAAGPGHGDQDVDAVRAPADVFVDPAQLGLELVGRVAGGTQDAEAPGPADSRDHVPAVAEGHDGELHATEQLADRVHDTGAEQAKVRRRRRRARQPGPRPSRAAAWSRCACGGATARRRRRRWRQPARSTARRDGSPNRAKRYKGFEFLTSR